MATAIIRWFGRQGVNVTPFKAQNMSNNARVVEGGEIGVAQWLQARAAGLEPSVDMNPVLLKPEADNRSQVVISGNVRPDITEMPWRERGSHVWPEMEQAYERLRAAHDLIVIEGAGSPAEINLPDLVNNKVLEHSDAAAMLVSDIDRGGSFAHLCGTWALVPDSTRKRLEAFVLNRFRGDPDLLAPGPAEIEQMTTMACLGVMPMLDHHLPDEEGATITGRAPAGSPIVAVVRPPFASNLDEFHLLSWAARCRWATEPFHLDGADLVILPGSKHVAADTAWLNQRGLDAALRERARAGEKIVGICGGAMMLGSEVDDPTGVEGATVGLGILPIVTTMRPEKRTALVRVVFSHLRQPWGALNGIETSGYEIRHGAVVGDSVLISPHLWASGPVLATTVHGLLEDPLVLEALTGHRAEPVLETTFDLLADAVEEHLDTSLLESMVE